MCAGKRGATITSIFSDSPSSFCSYKKVWISARLHRGKRQKRVCAFNGCLKLLVLQYMDSCVEVEGKKRWVIPYKVSLVIPYTV